MSKARNIADIGSDDVISTSSTGIDVTGAITADGLTVDAAVATIQNADIDNGATLRLDNSTDSTSGWGLGKVIGTLEYYLSNEGSTTEPVRAKIELAQNNATTQYPAQADLNFYTASSNTLQKNMTIASNGNVGIGTSTPLTGLYSTVGHISGASSGLILSSSTSTFGIGSVAGVLQFYDSTNSAERMRIDSSGNVGIGTTSPTARLHVHDATNRSLTSASGQVRIVGSGYAGYLALNGTSFQIGQNSSVRSLTFHSGSGMPERMRITSNGDVLVGTANISTNSGTQLYGTGQIYTHVDGTSSTNHMRFYRNNVIVGSVVTNGTSTAYNTSSDYRLKTDAQPMTGASDRVQALNPVNFEWIADGTRVDGFLAHEAQSVVPECATGTKDAMMDEEYEVTAAVYEDVVIEAVLDDEGNELEAERTEQNLVTEAVMGTRSVPDYQGIDQSKLVPLLTAALQEALTKIDTLEAQNATFETRLTALEAV